MANNIAVSITADVADLQVKRAIMSAELRAATKDLNDFAREAASTGSTDTLRTSMLAAGDAVAKLKTQISSADAEFKRLTTTAQSQNVTLGHATASAGQARFAMRDLSYQISDVSTSLAGGINPMIVFAQQGNQIVGAISMMTGEAKGFIGFLAGPWGAAIMGAVTLIGVLVSKHQEAAEKEALHAKKAMDLTGAIDELNKATGAANRTAEQQAKDALAAAEALYKQEIQTRRLTAATLEQRLAEQDKNDQIANSEYGGGGALGQSLARGEIDTLKAKLVEVNAALANAQKGFRGAQGFFTKQGIDDEFDAAAAATHRFERSVASLDARLKAAKVSPAQYAAEYRTLKQQLEADEKAARDAKKKPKKPKAEKDDLVQQLDAELTAKKLAWAKEQDAAGTAHQFSLAEEAAYWAKILQRTDLSAKDRAEIERKYLAAHSQITKERIAIVIDGYRQELAEAEKNAAAKLEIANRELAYIARTFGIESKEYAQAQAEIVRIKREAVQQQIELDELREKAIDKANLDQIAAAEEARFAIERAAAVRARAAVDPSKDPVKAKQLDLQLEQIEREHQARMTANTQQAVLRRTAIERTAISSVSSLWSQNIARLITLQQGFSATLKGIYQGMVQIVSNALATILEQWLVKHITTLLLGRAASSAAAVAQVASAAGVAGANGVASFAAAPWPIDLGAPAFGAAMAATAASFAPVASAEGGDWNVREGLYQLHAAEMVLPAWAASPLRDMLTGGRAANSNAPLAANSNGGGDTHIHIHAMDTQSIAKFARDNGHHFAAGVKRAVRDGFRG